MTSDRDDILDGIEAELRDTPEYLEFVVNRSEKENDLWKVFVSSTDSHSSGLDESLEGAVAWWLGPPKGGADVLSVLPEEEQINLRFTTCPPPSPGKKLRLYPPRYLEALHECWKKTSWANQSLSWLKHRDTPSPYDNRRIPNAEAFSWLRRRQADAFALVGWEASFLWGPPGTGKTTTLGAILAQYLTEFPATKALLLSTTNLAVDQALVAVDKAFEQLEHSPIARKVRKQCFRVGTYFVASQYAGREHLLPVRDNKLIVQLATLEARRPEPSNIQAYNLWKQQVEHAQAEMKKQAARVLDTARLAAMTTTRAVFALEEINTRKPYDLIVFDEASQVGLAHALIIAPLAKRCLFAGDPQQLAPIVRSQHLSAVRWLGRSMFARMNKASSSTCLLNEQSRMAEPICRIVSQVFYDGALVVADNCQHNPQWQNERTLVPVPPMGHKIVHLEMLDKNAKRSPQKYNGWIRYESAEFICNTVKILRTHVPEYDIAVLTPFKSQRTLIRVFLQNAGCSRVKVSTVHRAQGSEYHTVIFDPVIGNTKFLQTEDAPRLGDFLKRLS